MSTTSNSLQFQTKTNTNRPGKKKKNWSNTKNVYSSRNMITGQYID